MKGIISGVVATCLATVTTWGEDQNQKPADVHLVSERGPHSQTAQDLESYRDDQGSWSYQTNTYVHLEPGLNYRNAQGEWIETKEEFELLPQGAVARQGQHQVTLTANLNGIQPVTLVQPDGQVLTSRPHGLAYYDTATGEAVLLAEIKDCQGYQIVPNQILYTDAFDGVQADVRYTYTKSGFEQDIVLKQAPLAPEKYGLNSATTRLEVWSEFFQAPEPAIEAKPLNAEAVSAGTETPFIDSQLDFGAMKMAAGRAFQTGAEDGSAVPVGKSWIQDQGRTFLIEAVELPAVQPNLQALPQTPGGASLKHKPAKRATALRQLPATGKGQKKQQAAIKPATKELLAALIGPALVLDYSTQNTGNLTNQTFLGDSTYYIAGAVTLVGTNSIFEGGTVLKYANTNSPSVTVKTPLSWQGSLYRPVVLTAKDDKSVGDNVSGTGTPSGYYATTALNLDGSTNGANGSFTLAHVRIAYAQTAIAVSQQTNHSFSHLQIIACGNGINPTSAGFGLRNALFYNVLTNFNGSSATGRVEHLTVDGANWFNYNSTFATNNLTVTNSLLVAVTNYGGLTPTSVSSNSSPTGLFQSVLGGSHYLASQSSYRNAGTTAINASLASDLTNLTTYPPVLLTNSFVTDTSLSPQAQRDTDTPDLGYHYPPLDYIWKNLTNSSGTTLTLANGVAIGLHGTLGLIANGTFNSTGLPNQLNRLTLINTVQEQTQGIVTNSNGFSLRTSSANGNLTTLRFTDVAFVAAPTTSRQFSDYGNPIGDVTVQDCQLRGVYWYYLGDSVSHAFTLKNSICSDRTTINWGQGYSTFPNYLVVTLRNTLFNRSPLSLTHSGSHYGAWNLYDNLFDNTSTTLAQINTPPYNDTVINVGYNGFINTSNNLGGSNNKTGLIEDFQSGPLGNYYYPISGGGTSLYNLLDADSARTPGSVGLYFYTTRNDLAAETTGNLDIGFHYVATDSYGVPNDTDGDGVPDYLEDANGNSTVDSGETDWNSATDMGLRVLITRPTTSATLP